MLDSKNKKKPLWITLLRALVIAISALMLKSLTAFTILLTYTSEAIITDMQNYLMYIVTFISSVLIYNSVFSLFLSFDKNACHEYYAEEGEDKGLLSAIKSKSFLIQAITVSLLIALASALGSAPEIAGMFYFDKGKSPYSTGFVPFVTTLLLVPLIFIFQEYEAIRYWKALKKEGNLAEIENKRKIVIRSLIICIAYPLALPYLPILAYFLISLIQIAVTLFSLPAVILFFVLIILSFFAIRILSAINKRRLLLKRLRALARELSIKVSDIKYPYVSLLNYKRSCSFTLQIKDELFTCALLGAISRSVPVCFKSESSAYYRYRLGTKKHNVTLMKEFEYSKDAVGRKIVVICPTPKEVLLCDGNKEKRLFNAEKMWDSVVYEADAFLAAIDRECLGRHSTVVSADDVKIPKIPFI
jgi:hypothetical protein